MELVPRMFSESLRYNGCPLYNTGMKANQPITDTKTIIDFLESLQRHVDVTIPANLEKSKQEFASLPSLDEEKVNGLLTKWLDEPMMVEYRFDWKSGDGSSECAGFRIRKLDVVSYHSISRRNGMLYDGHNESVSVVAATAISRLIAKAVHDQIKYRRHPMTMMKVDVTDREQKRVESDNETWKAHNSRFIR